ncbi:MAG: bacteriohemerythrin, partial [Rhodospirillales bacterium]|nr:bacteriohemerythrin [Rhodospirillales bacterium]
HPERGMVPPDRFIPVCEESGLIVPLGTWVIRTACRQARAWLDAGLPPLRVGINISGRQFAEPNLVEIVRAALEETGIDPQGIELEMTESMLIQDVQSTLRILGELKKLGVGLSIDDFGTGYSSLAYLRQFAVDRLKIDRAFVSELHRNEEDRLIVTAVISLAHSLGMTTIAEGVELASQEALLADYGCEEMQGFVFSRPLPVADFHAFAMAHHARSQAKAAIDAAEPVTMPAMHTPGYKRHISWKRSMSIDILSIDRQHEELVAEVNTLFKMLTDKAGIDKCLAQLETIIVKTVEHFTHEERVMRNINYPNYHQHKEKHEWLVRDVQRFKESFASKVDEDDMYSIYNYLKYWLLRHLIGEDRRIRDYMYRKV